jgi:hypothetical protein
MTIYSSQAIRQGVFLLGLNNVRHIPSDYNVHWDVMNQTKLDSPLDSGIVAARELADIVNGQTQSPHLWWVGQFMKYALQLNSVTEDRIRKDKALIGIKSNCIGYDIISMALVKKLFVLI